MSANVGEVNDRDFDQAVLQADRPVLVDFWAAWCAPCRALAPRVEAVAARRADTRVVKIDIDQNPLVAQRYGVRAIPTLILFNHGREVERLLGAVSEAEIELRLDRQIGEALH
jgi:thioredoxin 1